MIYKTFKKIFIITGLVLTYGLVFHLATTKHVHAQKAAVELSNPTPAALSTLGSQVNSVINSNPSLDIAVSVVNLHNNQVQQYGETDPFEAASTAKLITAADYLHHVESGSAALDTNVEGTPAEQELQQMIEVSDDNDWAALNDFLGHDDLSAYANSIGLAQYDPDANTLPANDIARLLQKLYEGKLLDKSDTNLLLNYMANANYTNYIEAVVPGGVKFYHKAGFLDDRIHDAAIIDDGKHPIVLVIFTKYEQDDSNVSPTQAQVIQQIATDVLKTYSIT